MMYLLSIVALQSHGLTFIKLGVVCLLVVAKRHLWLNDAVVSTECFKLTYCFEACLTMFGLAEAIERCHYGHGQHLGIHTVSVGHGSTAYGTVRKGYGVQCVAWYHLLAPVLDRFVHAFDDPDGEENIEFWKHVVDIVDNGSGASYLSGWITAFCAFNEKGDWLGLPLSLVCAVLCSPFRVLMFIPSTPEKFLDDGRVCAI